MYLDTYTPKLTYLSVLHVKKFPRGKLFTLIM